MNSILITNELSLMCIDFCIKLTIDDMRHLTVEIKNIITNILKTDNVYNMEKISHGKHTKHTDLHEIVQGTCNKGLFNK